MCFARANLCDRPIFGGKNVVAVSNYSMNSTKGFLDCNTVGFVLLLARREGPTACYARESHTLCIVSPQSHSPFLYSLQTFLLNTAHVLKTSLLRSRCLVPSRNALPPPRRLRRRLLRPSQKYGVFCSLKDTFIIKKGRGIQSRHLFGTRVSDIN